jgi:hypothetical protein
MESLTLNIKQQVESMLQLTSKQRQGAEEIFKNLFEDVQKFQEDTTSVAKGLAEKSRAAMENAINKNDLRRELKALQVGFKHLEAEGSVWLDERLQGLESSIKSLQEKLNITTNLYDELLNKKKSSLYYSMMNDRALNQVLNLIDADDPGEFIYIVKIANEYHFI